MESKEKWYKIPGNLENDFPTHTQNLKWNNYAV